MAHSLESLFQPTSIAIIGISRSTPSLGRMILDNMITSSYQGDIYLVNPKAETIGSHKVYNTISSIPGKVDLAVILTPPRFVVPTLEQLAEKSCAFASIITAGFDDTTTEEILQTAKAGDIRIIGPNSMGTYGYNTHVSFSPLPIDKIDQSGKNTNHDLGFISQSGSIIAVAQECMTPSFGFSSFISLGNKIDITEIETLEYMSQDPSTKVIVCYLESFANPKQLQSTLQSITPHKPVIVVKGGRTSEGSKAVSSHTGALAGNFRLTSSLLQQSGVILAQTIDEAMNIARFISKFGTSAHTGIVTISSAGGPGVLAADEIVEAGLNLATLEKTTIKQLEDVIPSFGNAHNPLDLVADAGVDRYVDVINIVKHDPRVTTYLVIIVHPVLIDTTPLLDAIEALDLPVICSYLGPKFVTYDRYVNISVFRSTEEVVNILAKVNTYQSWKSKVSEYNDRSHLDLPSPPATTSLIDLLQSYGFEYPPAITTGSLEKATTWFDNLTSSVVLKLDHPKFSHKTDSGGVILDISSKTELEDAWQKLDNIYDRHSISQDERNIEVQAFYSDGLEIVLGAIRDDQFGHFILIGAGGTYVELLDDAVFIPSPTSPQSIKEALESLTIYPLLTGYRGSKPIDINKLVKMVLDFDRLIVDHPGVNELDINPLYIVPETGEMVVLDARIEIDKIS